VLALETHATRGVFGVVIPKFCFQNLARHGFDVLFSIVFRDSCEDEQALANGRYQLAIYCDRGRFDPLYNSCARLGLGVNDIVKCLVGKRNSLLMLAG
jgi:hypothetical protein